MKVLVLAPVVNEMQDFRSGGMFEDVVERFLEREEEIVAHFGGDGPRR